MVTVRSWGRPGGIGKVQDVCRAAFYRVITALRWEDVKDELKSAVHVQPCFD